MKWIKIEEGIDSTLPDEGVVVSAYTEIDGILPSMYIDEDGEWISDCYRWSGNRVTHWYLATPPEDK